MSIDLADLSPADRKRALALSGRTRAPRRSTFTKNQARSYAIRTLAVLVQLDQDQRARVLRLALEMNAV